MLLCMSQSRDLRRPARQLGRPPGIFRRPPGIFLLSEIQPRFENHEDHLTMDAFDEFIIFIEVRMNMALDFLEFGGISDDNFMYYYNDDGNRVYLV